LLRRGNRPEGLTPADHHGLGVLLATPVYFEFTGRRLPALDRPSILFFVSEEVHIGELPSLPPRPLLSIAGAAGAHTTPADQYAGQTDQSSSGYQGRESGEALSGFSYLQAAPFNFVPAGALLGALFRVSGLAQGYLTWRPRTAMTST
ncbi:MAG: hypothetical protein Q8R28_15495, partial [Dehalococcoidia bacterium]|nr:hypothetical protein [Dehalococcoidia bacterium]